MASKNIAQKTVDWAKLAATIPKTASADFNGFRMKHEEIRGKLAALAEKPTPVDWAFYKNNVKNEALVKKFQQQYTKVQVPYPEDTESAIIDQKIKDFEVKLATATQESAKRIAEIQKQIQAIKDMKPFEEITVEESMAQNPELVERANKEMKEIGWR